MGGVNTIGQRSVEGIVGDKRASRLSDMARRAKSAEGANTMHRRLRDAVRAGISSRAMFIALSIPALQGCLPDRLTDAELNAKIAAAQCGADGGAIIKGDCYIPGLGDIAGSDGSGNDGYGSDAKDGGADADVLVGDTIAMDSADGEDAMDGGDAIDGEDTEDGDDTEDTTDIGPILDINIGDDADDAIDVDPADIVEIGDDAEVDADDNGATDVDDAIDVDPADIVEIGDDAEVDADDVEIDAADNGATDAVDVGIDAEVDGATDVADDVGVDAITDSVTDAEVDGATDSVDGPEADAADNGATDAGGDLTDVNPADMAGDVTGSDGFIDSDGDGVLDSSGDVGADGLPFDASETTDAGPDVYVPQTCEGQPHGKVKPFYTGKPGTQGVGECAPGLLQCTDGTWINIDNEIVPVEEGAKCDGLDNDCDGATDETEVAVGSAIGECKQKIEGCVNGQWGTKYPAGIPQSETCDNKDNDCNGKTDDNGLGVPLSKTVPFSPLDGVGICQAQEEVCDAGNWKVVKAGVGAAAMEVCANKKDDDCDGKTDEVVDASGKPGCSCDGNIDGLVDTENWDPGFKAAVFAALGKGPNDVLTNAEADAITKLILTTKGLTGVQGIECLRNTTSANLNENSLTDGTPISALQKLVYLFASFNNFSNINWTENLPNLSSLGLSGNPSLKDISPILNNPGIGPGDTILLKGDDQIPVPQINTLKAKVGAANVIWP